MTFVCSTLLAIVLLLLAQYACISTRVAVLFKVDGQYFFSSIRNFTKSRVFFSFLPFGLKSEAK